MSLERDLSKLTKPARIILWLQAFWSAATTVLILLFLLGFCALAMQAPK